MYELTLVLTIHEVSRFMGISPANCLETIVPPVMCPENILNKNCTVENWIACVIMSDET